MACLPYGRRGFEAAQVMYKRRFDLCPRLQFFKDEQPISLVDKLWIDSFVMRRPTLLSYLVTLSSTTFALAKVVPGEFLVTNAVLAPAGKPREYVLLSVSPHS